MGSESGSTRCNIDKRGSTEEYSTQPAFLIHVVLTRNTTAELQMPRTRENAMLQQSTIDNLWPGGAVDAGRKACDVQYTRRVARRANVR